LTLAGKRSGSDFFTGQDRWGTIAAENLKKTSGKGAYAAAANKVADGMAAMYASDQLSDPAVIANVILKAVTARKPKTRYAAGYMAKPVMLMRHWLPDRWFDRIILRTAT